MSPSGTPSVGSNQPGDDEVIPTAIVIKNIPFNVKRETLLDIIVSIIVSAAQPRKKNSCGYAVTLQLWPTVLIFCC